MSVNWACTMDVAIRAVNWIYGYYLFEKELDNDKKFRNKLNSSLYSHGKFIYNNLENKNKYNNNHYLSNLAGLIFLGIYFSDFKLDGSNKPQKWLDCGLKNLKNEMFIQNNADGTNYEASTSYHRLVCEIYIYSTILAQKNGHGFTDDYMKRLELMFEFLMNITKPNGKTPLVGDVDNGRLVILSDYYIWDKNDFRYILSTAGIFFNRDDFKRIGSNYQEDCLWSLLSTYDINNDKRIQFSSKAYIDGGYYILRSENNYCLIRCGELSLHGKGGHSHNDQLSFELNINGEDFIIDPGLYVYTANYNLRNLYRSTRMHNTVIANGFEQNEFNNRELFSMPEQTYAKCLSFKSSSFVGEHYGYKEKCDLVHKRVIKLYEDVFVIKDYLSKKINKKAYVIFNLHPEVKVIEDNNSLFLINNKEKLKIKNLKNYVIEDSVISFGYGEKKSTKKILVKIEQNSKLKFLINY